MIYTDNTLLPTVSASKWILLVHTVLILSHPAVLPRGLSPLVFTHPPRRATWPNGEWG